MLILLLLLSASIVACSSCFCICTGLGTCHGQPVQRISQKTGPQKWAGLEEEMPNIKWLYQLRNASWEGWRNLTLWRLNKQITCFPLSGMVWIFHLGQVRGGSRFLRCLPIRPGFPLSGVYYGKQKRRLSYLTIRRYHRRSGVTSLLMVSNGLRLRKPAPAKPATFRRLWGLNWYLGKC